MDSNIIEGKGTATGTDAYLVALSVAITGFKSLGIYVIQFTNANTGASTLNVNGIGAKDIKRADGTDLLAGDIGAGSIQYLAYDGAQFISQIVSGGGGITYKSYIASVTQVGVNTPVMLVFQDNMIDPVTITRNGVGIYQLDSADFILNKVWADYTSDFAGSNGLTRLIWDESGITGYFQLSANQSAGQLNFEIFNAAFVRVDLSTLMGTGTIQLPEIRVYP